MTFQEAMIQARAMSIDNHASQHVNRRLDGSYYTSDWYNADSTVITFESGRALFLHDLVCMGTIAYHICELDYSHDAHMI